MVPETQVPYLYTGVSVGGQGSYSRRTDTGVCRREFSGSSTSSRETVTRRFQTERDLFPKGLKFHDVLVFRSKGIEDHFVRMSGCPEKYKSSVNEI